MSHVTPLNVEAIRAFLASREEMEKRLRRRPARGSMSLPWQMPDVMRGENLLHLMRDQFDAVAGHGAGDHMAMQMRLAQVLGVLARGTVADAIERDAAQAERMGQLGVDAETLRMMRANLEVHAAQLRLITDDEVRAVLACLDELEAAFRMEVAQIRMRHVPGERERREAEADAGRAADAEDGPRLSPRRIARVLSLVPAIAADSRRVAAFFRDPGVYSYWGVGVEKAFGKKAMKTLAKHGEDPEAFFTDLNWIRIISRIIAGGGTVAASLAKLKTMEQPDAWTNPYERPGKAARQAAAFASGMSEVAAIQRKISREAEEAVRRLLPEIQRVARETAGTPAPSETPAHVRELRARALDALRRGEPLDPEPPRDPPGDAP
ncbi:MAG TPA: hypothetical protein VFR37_22005 [Longimicrobium sp.]|nr:hypothetical protein [Longimicrobium sp.]